MLDKVENGLKMLFRLSPNVRYYVREFNVLLYNGFGVSNQTWGFKSNIDPMVLDFVVEHSVWSLIEHSL